MHAGGHVLNAKQFSVVTLMFEMHLATSRVRLLRAAGRQQKWLDVLCLLVQQLSDGIAFLSLVFLLHLFIQKGLKHFAELMPVQEGSTATLLTQPEPPSSSQAAPG